MKRAALRIHEDAASAPEIVRNIPPPTFGRGPRNFPFAAMKPGDFFLASNGTAARSAAQYFALLKGVKFCTRREGDGVRVWRIDGLDGAK